SATGRAAPPGFWLVISLPARALTKVRARATWGRFVVARAGAPTGCVDIHTWAPRDVPRRGEATHCAAPAACLGLPGAAGPRTGAAGRLRSPPACCFRSGGGAHISSPWGSREPRAGPKRGGLIFAPCLWRGDLALPCHRTGRLLCLFFQFLSLVMCCCSRDNYPAVQLWLSIHP
ncbi:unnamed protein product, partial [Amoebophrya sp. A120]